LIPEYEKLKRKLYDPIVRRVADCLDFVRAASGYRLTKGICSAVRDDGEQAEVPPKNTLFHAMPEIVAALILPVALMVPRADTRGNWFCPNSSQAQS
jgi:hypothetical protein